MHVGNLSYSVTENVLRERFAACGEVKSVKLITDETGRSKGFAFIEMSDIPEAEKAISDLNGTDLDGRSLKVSEAKPRNQGREFRGGNRRGGFRRSY